MMEYQVQYTSFPYMTTACFSVIALTLLAFPVEYLWKRMFPDFRVLPKHLRRHDTNLLIRVATSPIMEIVFIFITVKTFQDINWWIDNREFIGSWVLIFIMVDLFDLTQKRKFEWHPYVHHLAETGYALFYLEWGPAEIYNRGFPLLGLILFSLSHRPMLGLFPLRRVASNDNQIQLYAKFAFADIVFAIVVGIGVMVGLIIKHQDHLPLSGSISQPIMFLFFNGIDLPFYFFIYKIAYPKPGPCEEKGDNAKDDNESSDVPEHARHSSSNRHSIMQLMTNLDLDSEVGSRRSTLLGMPFYADGKEEE